MFLVGMGADEDVHDMLSLDDEQFARVRVVVMDSHRPLHHRNNSIHDGDRLAVLVDPSDGATDVDALPAPSAGACMWGALQWCLQTYKPQALHYMCVAWVVHECGHRHVHEWFW